MGHGVDDVIHADGHADVGEFQGIAGCIGPFPEVADIRIQRNLRVLFLEYGNYAQHPG